MKRKFGIVCGLSAIFCLLWVFFNNISNGSVINEGVLSDEEKLIINKEISCYFDHSRIDSIEPFNEKDITGDNNIFFIETSCFGDRGIVLDARQCCSIESAAKMNPKMKIYLLILSPLDFSPSSQKLLSHLEQYENIVIRRIFMGDFVKNSPLEDWWASGKFKTSNWPKHHMSDVLRFLTLWKIPGIYMDLDVVTLSSFENLRDFVGAEDLDTIASCVMSFGSTEIGRKIADACIHDLKNNFRGDVWRNNGPDVITRILHKICQADNIANMIDNCHGFTIFSPWEFTPIYYDDWKKYFEVKDKDETLKLINDSLAIHTWNKLSHSQPIKVGSPVPYGIIANQYCPKIYNNCGLWF
ncbi:lactosylceramide 4-alpha-galactosyltransferase [Microplitis demolitor]|uniref:lactosylceramide 4-alpha-galactosyltransferase n=1 Tax=Microplitis demolitor TaxID=69319 RepID=UPI00043FFE51|nr:lactosylceramide 4-alpha-galactosyltransferase [Microplitis demolitor]XP_008548392.1 lactosylceramide 4-alpha-galactosyltransferase [Microplitis demolitor]XP_008548393.1 lactosylceramide 4-alpha-galactosyltransferase [Microplitis demolitor]XP_014297448.1 lactosylceramide 4-alpha-galactosyltransferase [Microplitis demolitor]